MVDPNHHRQEVEPMFGPAPNPRNLPVAKPRAEGDWNAQPDELGI